MQFVLLFSYNDLSIIHVAAELVVFLICGIMLSLIDMRNNTFPFFCASPNLGSVLLSHLQPHWISLQFLCNVSDSIAFHEHLHIEFLVNEIHHI